MNSLKFPGVGSFTKWSDDIASGDPVSLKVSLIAIPAITATKAPGIALIFFRNSTFVNAIKMNSDTNVIIIAPGWE